MARLSWVVTSLDDERARLGAPLEINWQGIGWRGIGWSG